MNPIETGAPREYENVHYAARKVISETCKACGSQGPVEAALRHETPTERLFIDPATGCAYSRDPHDYFALCVPCHRRMDRDARTHCKRGHEYSAENTLTKPDGARRCRTCHRDGERERTAIPEKRAAKREADREYRKQNPLTPAQKARRVELQRARRAAARFEHGESS